MSYKGERLSLCIPRLEDGVTENTISDIFEKLNIGIIKNIKIVNNPKKNARKAFINISKWKNNSISENIKTRLNEQLPVNIMYCAPWFWKLKYAY